MRMGMTAKEVIKILKKNGWKLVRIKGSHHHFLKTGARRPVVDQILVIEDGSISQKGTHNELMKQIGLYKKLWDMQYQTEKWKI